ncbi:beta-1,6-N-acetylglucosaminyltransferase [Williamsia sp.]|uniref:beta-1,6-N-acetylglucosaminyltransferase n=1 Tax=Williamsia sp. TaxID=1872085 RepID=UPI002F95163A
MTARAAVLILEHQQPQRLAALLRSLDHPGIDIYVHIDARMSCAPFEEVAPAGPRLTYLDDEDRVEVSWGSLSLVEASLATLRAALGSGREYGRYALLSGADLRIAPLEEILAAWSTSAEYMRIDRALTVPGAEPSWQVRRRHFNGRKGVARRVLSGRIPRSVDNTIEMFQGSQWWALTDGAVRYICDFVDRHPDWLRFHRHTFGPDEIVIQSIVASSPYVPCVTQNLVLSRTDPTADPLLHGMHYIDWSDATSSSPRVLSLDDVPNLRRSSAFFARKLGRGSADLVELFERELSGR